MAENMEATGKRHKQGTCNRLFQENPQEELRQLEEKCKEVYGAYEEAVNVTKTLEAENIKIKEEQLHTNNIWTVMHHRCCGNVHVYFLS